MGCRVEGQEEEKPLNVNDRAVLGDKIDQVADVVIKELQIRDLDTSVYIDSKTAWTHLIASKLGPQQCTRMRPAGSIKSKNPIAQQRVEFLVSVSKAEVLELRGQHSLEVFWFVCIYEFTEHPLTEGGSVDLKTLSNVLDPSLLLHRDR